MAGQGKPIDQRTRDEIQRLRVLGKSIKETADAVRVNPSTVVRNSPKRD